MTASRRVGAAILIAALAAGCSVLAPSVRLRTAQAPSDLCMLSALGGTLAQNEDSGLGVMSADGTATAVEWPFGYSARSELGRLVLIDATGKTVAREGDRVEVGGGRGDDVFEACDGVTVTNPAS